MKKIVALMLLACVVTYSARAQWAHLFHKKITADEAGLARQHNCFFFTKVGVPMYSQLLLSWNALRPRKGHFVFFVQARNAHTMKWGRWHRMLEWGRDKQKSYATASDGFTKYVHVRLEVEPLQLADAFRIKVVGAKGASLSMVKSVAVTTANMNGFAPEDVEKNVGKLVSVHLRNVPKISQFSLEHDENHRICSPVSCAVLSRFVTRYAIDPLRFARASYDNGLKTYGSWPFNMAHMFECARGKVACYNTRLNSFQDIHAQLKRGVPAVVSVRGSLPRAPRPYNQGHLLTVVGYDASTKEVICHDSAIEGHSNVEQRYALADFVRSWEASRRLTYWIERV